MRFSKALIMASAAAAVVACGKSNNAATDTTGMTGAGATTGAMNGTAGTGTMNGTPGSTSAMNGTTNGAAGATGAMGSMRDTGMMRDSMNRMRDTMHNGMTGTGMTGTRHRP